MNTYYSRRKALGIGLGGLSSLALLGLAGCDEATPSASNQDAAISMNMFFWGSAKRNQLTREAITLYQQMHSNVTISSQYSGNNVYYTKLDQQIASGKAPDLIQMDMRYISRYVREGALLELSPYIYNQTINLSDFNALQILSSKVNNGIYGVSLGSNYQCMLYDQTQLQKTGFNPPTVDMTWAQFATYLIDLSQALGDGIYGSSDSSGNYDNFEIWIRGRGKELYTVDGHLDFDLADIADWFGFWAELRAAKACIPANIQASLDLTGTPVDSSVIKGKAVFSHIFSNLYIAFQAATSHTLTLAVYPKSSVAGMYIKAALLQSISANTRYPTQAADFTSFLITNPQAVKTLGFERGVPNSAAALAYLAPHFTPQQKFIVDFMNYVANIGATRVKVVLEPPGAGQVATILQQVAQKVGLGSMSVSAGAQAFYTQAQMALKLA